MKQNASCRRMRLSDSDYRLLHLAGPGLEALNCDLATCEIWQVGRMLRGFPGLTRLELHEGYMLAEYAFRIRKLPLQELVLCGCDKLQLELHLFSESALTSLRKLHIEEGAKRQRSYLAEPEPHRLARVWQHSAHFASLAPDFRLLRTLPLRHARCASHLASSSLSQRLDDH